MTLYQPLPESLLIDGKEYRIETDFRVWIRFQNISTKSKNESEKMNHLIEFLSKLSLPFNQAACEAVLDFFMGVSCEKNTGRASSRVTFDFEQDSEYIYSAFLTQYSIDLSIEQIHWWKFKALFKALGSDLEISKIMLYRGMDMKDVPKEQKKFYSEMKQRYTLKGDAERKMTTEEYLMSMREHIRKRYEENSM